MKNAIKVFVIAVTTLVFSGVSFAQATPATPAKPATPAAVEKKSEKAMEKAAEKSDDASKDKAKAKAKSKTKKTTKKTTEKTTEKMEEKKTGRKTPHVRAGVPSRPAGQSRASLGRAQTLKTSPEHPALTIKDRHHA